jgi:CRISPR type I-E-associated protein CasB/Cse2
MTETAVATTVPQKVQKPEVIVANWWKDLNDARKPRHLRNRPGSPFDSGDSAELRRCKTLDEIVLNSQAFHTLRKRLVGTVWEHAEILRLAVVAGVLSHVRLDAKVSLPQALGNKTKSDQASKEAVRLRFQRLIQHRTHDDVFRPMVRMLDYLEKEGVSVLSLAKELYCWNDETRKRWAIKFYETVLGTKE